MDELIRKSDAIEAIKRYALEAYDINLERPEEFAGNSANERFCEGLFEATEVVEAVETADDRDDIIRCKNCKLWEKYENTAGSGYCHCKKFEFHYGPRMDRIFNPITGPNEYCSFAERKKDERNS